MGTFQSVPLVIHSVNSCRSNRSRLHQLTDVDFKAGYCLSLLGDNLGAAFRPLIDRTHLHIAILCAPFALSLKLLLPRSALRSRWRECVNMA